jgi:hypothetical protein
MTAPAPDTLNDPRWVKFHGEGLDCSCGERHVGLFAVQLLQPISWSGPADYEPDAAVRMDGNFLSENFCVQEGKSFLMRMRLPINIKGAAPAAFMFTVWASLSRMDFEGYLERVRSGRMNANARAPARLLNRLAAFPDTVHLSGSAFAQTDSVLPILIIHGIQANPLNGHPLMAEQQDGIGLDRMFELFAAYSHDMRPSLAGL